ncbi:hypothetical protein NDI56_03785 [Haloarcula sp. S1CR25-12]|uniref:Uncharacterized protein n=1 Tax=Haloarcula saliterrae TaxID=2950534 RepID=A0ABU2F9Y9_9EURY|nr:hypothetical protein [Haloarcula sp. S1CR25-12]MDS0258531.1 hypothetical protein [Haloarcula sp. S1CR25-12]
MVDGTKYDSVLDALKITKTEFDSELSGMALEWTKDDDTRFDASTGDLRNWAREYLDGHEWFESFDGATLGAIVEFADVDPQALTRWHCQGDAAAALETMAEEAIIEQFVAEVQASQEQVLSGGDQ